MQVEVLSRLPRSAKIMFIHHFRRNVKFIIPNDKNHVSVFKWHFPRAFYSVILRDVSFDTGTAKLYFMYSSLSGLYRSRRAVVLASLRSQDWSQYIVSGNVAEHMFITRRKILVRASQTPRPLHTELPLKKFALQLDTSDVIVSMATNFHHYFEYIMLTRDVVRKIQRDPALFDEFIRVWPNLGALKKEAKFNKFIELCMRLIS